MKPLFYGMAVCLLAFSVSDAKRAYAAHGYPAQAACWTALPADDERPDVTCLSLSEQVLEGLRHATPAQVTARMGVPGKGGKPVHFESASRDPGAFSGFVDLDYTRGKASRLLAVISQVKPDGMAGPMMTWRWDARTGACSDFPGSSHRCPED